jgi:hypothetical protein
LRNEAKTAFNIDAGRVRIAHQNWFARCIRTMKTPFLCIGASIRRLRPPVAPGSEAELLKNGKRDGGDAIDEYRNARLGHAAWLFRAGNKINIGLCRIGHARLCSRGNFSAPPHLESQFRH